MSERTFETWFVAQHGPSPQPGATERLRREIAEMAMVLRRKERTLRAVEEWEAKRTSALYAWQITDAQKRGAE